MREIKLGLSYKELKEIKKCDVLFESSSLCNVKFTVVDTPVEVYVGSLKAHQLSWLGAVDGEADPIEYLATEGMMHYGPSICRTPEYVGVPNRGY
jgi:hypothetical protein